MLLVLLAFFTSCASKYTFNTSAGVPAAIGSVKVKKDNNNNYNIDLSVNRLADSKRLTPAKALYVVWMNTEHNGVKNIGQIKTSSGLFSNALKSTLKTVTPFEPTTFFITAENEADIQYPSGIEVLRTTVK
jgi:hypothetical protein